MSEDFPDPTRARRITPAETESFERPGFTGHWIVKGAEQQGFSALSVDVHGRHPAKRMEPGTTRTYFVVAGEGTFTIDGVVTPVGSGDFVVLPPGSQYEYESPEMSLFELNVSPDNSFQDTKLEN